jgi:hypothetical protein
MKQKKVVAIKHLQYASYDSAIEAGTVGTLVDISEFSGSFIVEFEPNKPVIARFRDEVVFLKNTENSLLYTFADSSIIKLDAVIFVSEVTKTNTFHVTLIDGKVLVLPNTKVYVVSDTERTYEETEREKFVKAWEAI